MSENKLVVRKVRGKDIYCVKLNGKELCNFDSKLDALNYKAEFLGKNNENLHLEEKEEKKEEKKDCQDNSCALKASPSKKPEKKNNKVKKLVVQSKKKETKPLKQSSTQ